jgi:16S rRNA (cytosine1402-N4)-methyltransferase
MAVHVPVMVEQVLEALEARKGGMFLDCTFGGGGHSRAILDASPDSWVIAVDRDARAVERSKAWADRYGDRLEVHHARFSRVSDVVGLNKFDGILADLGMSTDQLREGRGFSFADESLDMRMDEGAGISAREFVNTAAEREIFLALAEGGVGKNAKLLARTIVRERPFEGASDLAAAIKASQLGKRSESKVHPATVVFQALRMKVNDERREVESLLDAAASLAKPGGRLAVITFHSIEDQIVTGRMRDWASAGSYPASWRGPRDTRAIGSVVTKKPLVPDDREIAENPASRSARLRVFEFARDRMQ